MLRAGFSEFQKSLCKCVPNFIRRCVRDDSFCAGKILAQENIAPVDGYVHLMTFSNEGRHGMAPQGTIYLSKLKNTQEIK